jgi:endonuclease YncB( thermonuclease family)
MANARRALVAAALLVLASLVAVPAAAQQGAGADVVVGDVRVRGAGVIVVANQWFYLLGASTFERDELCHLGDVPYQCGLIAQGKLAELAHKTQYQCTLREFPGDSRRWGTCVPYDFVARGPIPGGEDLARAWVRSGWAFAHRLHTQRLVADEEMARAAKLGVWAGTTPTIAGDAPKQAVGAAYVIDGNSLRVGGTLIRLAGIDAPEAPQSCGLGPGQGGYFCGIVARGILVYMTMGKRIYCSIERRSGDDRNWGTCGEANAAGTGMKDGDTVNAQMVRDGWALADRRTSNHYLDLQIEADNKNIGLWQGTFTNPRDWRLGWR